jgi:hypothetical protein
VLLDAQVSAFDTIGPGHLVEECPECLRNSVRLLQPLFVEAFEVRGVAAVEVGRSEEFLQRCAHDGFPLVIRVCMSWVRSGDAGLVVFSARCLREAAIIGASGGQIQKNRL